MGILDASLPGGKTKGELNADQIAAEMRHMYGGDKGNYRRAIQDAGSFSASVWAARRPPSRPAAAAAGRAAAAGGFLTPEQAIADLGVTAYDAGADGTKTFTVDTAAPAAPVISLPVDLSTTSTTPTISGPA